MIQRSQDAAIARTSPLLRLGRAAPNSAAALSTARRVMVRSFVDGLGASLPPATGAGPAPLTSSTLRRKPALSRVQATVSPRSGRTQPTANFETFSHDSWPSSL